MFEMLSTSYYNAGISVIPVDGKRVPVSNFGKYSHRLPNANEIKYFKARFPMHNIGLMLGPVNNLMGIDIDTNNTDVLKVIEFLAPETPVEKIGKRGKTSFYRSNILTNEMMFNKDEGCMLEFLCTSKQTVIPPSIHPSTKNKYRWLSGTLLDNIKNIPQITQDILDEIKEWMVKKYQVINFKEYSTLKSGAY
jgi:hypothetical protein